MHYPRRAAVSPSPYPASLPAGLLDDARDPQQDMAWLEHARHRVRNLEDGHDYVSGLIEATRTDVLALPAHAMPQGGFSVEHLLVPDGPLEGLDAATLSGYDNKGQPVRTWLPYYLDDWRPVSDDSGHPGLYADTQLYDAMGRVYRVLTAAGWERRTEYYPWFTVAQDENDTA
ncbi:MULTISPECIES: toxin TcdB middle/C-terminal domain-containing protein [unclassified Pseudomonas]|uniref:toxin TcdB middle/C-terminal domain-containing protein n=1 Tax=unclassified Pseudomonas TaxID=196821 RepID=UPI000A0B359B|nr:MULTISPECIES: toxin TcdB middle/C-terminal domain-containing protein [unclassified Pseudomonas]SMF32561.1 Insecticide toxin TcdB middle/C-terminal region [Pseudomonas sp. LAIL14HWK12:I11]SMR77980.1 Insecticide toxin TcdB middle/C-terminal region [Pseudomonas sp. LAIL14HWK12:I10]SOD04267.1 Insecticide toxin TcdB middle/C-terminal region [Pseudomonas sp. LAIL14HWK12:I8]